MNSIARFLEVLPHFKKGVVGITAKKYPHHTLEWICNFYRAQGYRIEYVSPKNLFEQIEYTPLTLFQEESILYQTQVESLEEAKKIAALNPQHKSILCFIPASFSLPSSSFHHLFASETFLTSGDASSLLPFFVPELHYFIQETLLLCKKISLENLLHYLTYARCIQRSAWGEYVSQLHASSTENIISLFDLSQSFFQKNKSEFYKLWTLAISLYPPEFWGVYWSDQLWLAYSFCLHAKSGMLLPIKKLPRWFTQEGYRRYKPTDFIDPLVTIAYYDSASKLYAGATLALDKLFANWLIKK